MISRRAALVGLGYLAGFHAVQAFGITIPNGVLLLADKVLE